MIFKNKTVQKFLSLLLILSILSPAAFIAFSAPKKAEAMIPVIDLKLVYDIIKQAIVTILKNFLRKVATKLLDKMTQSTVNWVNEGFHGAPLFVENPGSFFKNVVNTQLNTFINETAYDQYKFPFGKSTALGIISNAKNSFAQNAQYSLSQYNLSAQEFARQQNDFSAGGFGGLLMNTQLMQNNFLGYGLLAEKEVNTRLAGAYSAPQQVKDKVLQGAGFLSQETCVGNPSWDPTKAGTGPGPADLPPLPTASGGQIPDLAAYSAAVAQVKANWATKYGCPQTNIKSTTPGSIAAGSVMTALGSKQRQGELSAQVGNALAAIFDAILNKFLDAGLNAVSNKIAGNNNPATADPQSVQLTDFNTFGDKGTSEPGGYLGGPGGPPTSKQPQLSVTVNIVNDNGGQTYDPGLIQAYVGGNPIKTNTPYWFAPGPELVTLQDVAGYYKIITGDCDKDGNALATDRITLGLVPDEEATCTFTLDDIPTGNQFSTGNMQVDVNITNNDYGLASNQTLKLLVGNAPRLSGVAYKYPAGNTTVSVTLPDMGYTLSYLPECNPDGTITITPSCKKSLFGSSCNATQICQVQLDDIPGWHVHWMAVNVVVINDNATTPGTLTQNGVTIYVDGSTSTQVTPATTILSGVKNLYTSGDTVTAPIHVVTGTVVPGYTVTYSGACDTKGNVQLPHVGSSPSDPITGIQTDVQTCTMTYNDN